MRAAVVRWRRRGRERRVRVVPRRLRLRDRPRAEQVGILCLQVRRRMDVGSQHYHLVPGLDREGTTWSAARRRLDA